MTGSSVQPQLEPVHVSLPPGDDLGSFHSKVGVLHSQSLDVRHLRSEQGQAFQTGNAARFVLAQGIQAKSEAITWLHLPMIDPGSGGRQGGAS